MASTSFAKQTFVPMKEAVSSYTPYPPPLVIWGGSTWSVHFD
ncbi:hypothetical protein E1A91_D01G194800v1 [Gossypium mustelinum]|uniref:Uncharacterized protein n=3 Tax=Gossypium TaxID=3633 RepID=A0A0D2Q925_GOSRA|nr:hypothetical protein B456_002G194700 [Gossypium raimondii]TYH88681.1 hypothetical protein ES332_D01G204800v1 [Gossypium tomentosum]TYI98172.1 hypothetical protein E1A91_D01G194800v1 [Gossypium mustelinum]